MPADYVVKLLAGNIYFKGNELAENGGTYVYDIQEHDYCNVYVWLKEIVQISQTYQRDEI